MRSRGRLPLLYNYLHIDACTAAQIENRHIVASLVCISINWQNKINRFILLERGKLCMRSPCVHYSVHETHNLVKFYAHE